MSAPDDRCVRCLHRGYDHDTEDGSCWKCDCRRLVPTAAKVQEAET